MMKSLCNLFLILMLTSGAFAQTSPHIYIRMDTDEVSQNDTVAIEIGVSSGDSIKSVFLRLDYEEQIYRFLTGTPARLFQGACFWDIHREVIQADSMLYMVGVMLGKDRFVSAPGPFFYLQFAARDSGRALFKLDSLTFLSPSLRYFDGTADTLETYVNALDSFPPDPITDFKVQEHGSGSLKFTWRNPTDTDFKGTLILRSEDDFIRIIDTSDALVYEGTGTSFIDDNLVNGTQYYYTAYAFDEIPNYSQPVFLKAEPKEEYVYAYPNPFNPDDGMTFKIMFPYNTFIDITIFDAVGNRVIKLYEDREITAMTVSDKLRWNGRDNEGNLVANGVYYYVVKTSQGDQKIEKVAVLR